MFLENIFVKKQHLQNIFIRFDCEIFLVQINSSKIIISEIYKNQENGKLIEKYFGEYTQENEIKINQLSIHRRRNDMGGIKLTGAFMLVRV